MFYVKFIFCIIAFFFFFLNIIDHILLLRWNKNKSCILIQFYHDDYYCLCVRLNLKRRLRCSDRNCPLPDIDSGNFRRAKIGTIDSRESTKTSKRSPVWWWTIVGCSMEWRRDPMVFKIFKRECVWRPIGKDEKSRWNSLFRIRLFHPPGAHPHLVRSQFDGSQREKKGKDRWRGEEKSLLCLSMTIVVADGHLIESIDWFLWVF